MPLDDERSVWRPQRDLNSWTSASVDRRRLTVLSRVVGKLEQVLENRHKDDDPATVEEMAEYFGQKLETEDQGKIIDALKKFIKGSDVIYTKEGKFYSKNIE